MSSGSTTPPPGSSRIVLGTDPRGTVVWISAETLERKSGYHTELRRTPHHTSDAVEDPELIAGHPDHVDREVYVGRDRPASDPALAPARRIIVVANTGTTNKVITAYDEYSSNLQTKIGATKWPVK